MPRGRRTSYVRDNRGRFASSPGGGGPKRSTPATRRAAMRAGNRLNRDNAGRISGIGRNGATVRGGRLRTAGGNRRATQIASMRPTGFRSGTIAKGGRGISGPVARSLAAVRAAGGRKAAGLSRARPGQEQRAMQRAQANEKRLQGPAMRGTGLRTRAGVGYAVAKGAQGYYSGSMPRRKATFSPLTGSMDKKALAARRKQVVDNNKPKKPKPAGKPAAGSVRTVNRTRAEAAAAYKKRIRPARAAAARMAPADKPVSVSRPDGNLIVGKTWEQIQAAQRGSKRALNGGAITGKPQKPKATQGDRRLLAQKGMKGLKAEGMNGVLDRLRTSKVRIGGKPNKSSAGIRKPLSTTKAATKKKAARGPRVRLPRMATPTGVIRGSDRAKVKADARKGISTPYSTPYSRASQRAFDRSAREAPLQRKQAIAAAKRKGRTGFGKGPQMNARSIGNRDFNWNRNEQPATAQERLAMWRKGERRMRGFWSGGRGVAGAYAGELRASRRAAALVDSGNRLGNLPTTRKMAEQPRQRRLDRVKQNETRGSLASSDADRRLLPQIQKVRDAAQKRIAEGKRPTAAQREKERKLVGEYNKATRQFLVAKAAKSYMQNPYGFKPQRMSGAVKPKPAKPTAPKRTRSARPAGTVAKPRGMKPGVLAARRGAKAKPKFGKVFRGGEGQTDRAVKRAKTINLRRSISESDRNNAYYAAVNRDQVRPVPYERRQMAEAMRMSRAQRTQSAALQFLSTYGPASLFARRPVSRTSESPNFGSKRRGRRRSKP